MIVASLTYLAVPSNGSILWQPSIAKTSGIFLLLAVPSNGSILWQQVGDNKARPPYGLACSTLQRVYPLATYIDVYGIGEAPNLQYPPTGLSSGNEPVLPMIIHLSDLAVPSNGSILWQL